MALGTPTVMQPKKYASSPYDVYQLTFKADAAYPAGGYADFQDFVRTALGRSVTVLSVERAGVLLDAAGGVVNLIPTYDMAADKLYFIMASTGEEIAASALTAATDVVLLVHCY